MVSIITIIVPVFNEEAVLPNTIKELVRFKKNSPIKIDLLFVDDGSTDSSLEILNAFDSSEALFDVLCLESNQGLSTALKAGFDAVDTPWIGYIDADLQTHPDDFLKLYPFMEAYDLITGIREQRQDSVLKRFSSRFANWFRQLFTNDGIKDTGCPLKLIKTSFARQVLLFDGMHRFIPALVQLFGGTTKQVAINHYPRQVGKSKFNMFNRSVRPLIDCFVFLWMKRRLINYAITTKD